MTEQERAAALAKIQAEIAANAPRIQLQREKAAEKKRRDAEKQKFGLNLKISAKSARVARAFPVRALNEILNGFAGRLERIENTLAEINKHLNR